MTAVDELTPTCTGNYFINNPWPDLCHTDSEMDTSLSRKQPFFGVFVTWCSGKATPI